MSNFKFYFYSVLAFLVCTFLGFFTGAKVIYNFLISTFGRPYGEEVLAFAIYSMVFSISTSLLGIAIALIAIHKMGRRWGKYLTFGSHPVLKLTALSFVTYLIVLFFILKVYNFLTG